MSSIHQKTLGDKIRLTKQRVVVVVYIAPHSKISVETFQVQLKAPYINKLWKKMSHVYTLFKWLLGNCDPEDRSWFRLAFKPVH